MQVYVVKNGKRSGPFTVETIKANLAAGLFDLSDLCWWDGCQDWIPLSNLPSENQAISPPPIPPPSPGPKTVGDPNKPAQTSIILKIVAGVAAVFLLVTITNDCRSHSSQFQAQTAITSVLQQARSVIAGASSATDLVNRASNIDTSACPNDYRAAYLAWVHAWGAMAEVEQRAVQLEKDNDSVGAGVEAFIRGFMGDPFGKVKDEMDAQNQLEQDANAAKRQITQAGNTADEIATRYGVDINRQ